MVIIGVDQSLSNSELYEHSCLGNIKNLHKSDGKCDDKQQHKAVLEACWEKLEKIELTAITRIIPVQ